MNPVNNNDIIGKITPPIKGWGGDIESVFGKLGANALKLFIAAAGIVALIYLLKGSLNWISSGGDKEKLTTARNTLTHAIVGLLIIFAIIAGIYTIETVVFNKEVCFGLSCPVVIPSLE